MRTKKLVVLTTAAAAWAFIAAQAQESEKNCGVQGFFLGLCARVEYLDDCGLISAALAGMMHDQLEETFEEDSACTSAGSMYFWSRDKDGWEQRVIAATLLSELAKDEGK